MADLGEVAVGAIITMDFNTASSGTPTTLSGSPAISVYKDSTTESTSGVTLTADYDSRTGMNHVKIDTTSDTTFYADGNYYSVVVTTGTVAGTSVVGYVVGSFYLTTSKKNILKSGGSIGRGTVGSAATNTSVTTSAFTPSVGATDQFKGRTIIFDGDTTTTSLRGQATLISGGNTNSATPTFTVDALTTNPASGDTFSIV
jgi:hypothetical protein